MGVGKGRLQRTKKRHHGLDERRISEGYLENEWYIVFRKIWIRRIRITPGIFMVACF